jgi:hypothetical protein
LDKDPRLGLGLDEREVYDFIAKNNIKMAKIYFYFIKLHHLVPTCNLDPSWNIGL